MGRNLLSAALVVLGLVLVALSVSWDALGLGSGDYVFGWDQKLGVALGATTAWFGCLRLLGWSPFAARRRAATARDVDEDTAATLSA
jgi:hypothetical protein